MSPRIFFASILASCRVHGAVLTYPTGDPDRLASLAAVDPTLDDERTLLLPDHDAEAEELGVPHD